jgi:hypothetical protein
LVIDRESQDRLPAVYISTDQTPYIDAYWRFYLLKHGREALLDRTVYFTGKTLNLETVAPKSLMVVGPRDAEILVASGRLRRIASIPEPADPPFFSVWER